MYRLAAALLCALVPLGLLAAPAPEPRPWFTGWYKPVDPVGDCRFDRDGGKLTITVPGTGHELDFVSARLNAPRLLRDVEGDFVAAVRVGGTFRPAGLAACQRAGLLLTDGRVFVRVLRVADNSARPEDWKNIAFGSDRLGQRGWFLGGRHGPALSSPAYLRVERRGVLVWGEFSQDGKGWSTVGGTAKPELPRKVKVGVIAESTAPGVFKPWFDQFKLSRPKR